MFLDGGLVCGQDSSCRCTIRIITYGPPGKARMLDSVSCFPARLLSVMYHRNIPHFRSGI
jgi:hypothetical protein